MQFFRHLFQTFFFRSGACQRQRKRNLHALQRLEQKINPFSLNQASDAEQPVPLSAGRLHLVLLQIYRKETDKTACRICAIGNLSFS